MAYYVEPIRAKQRWKHPDDANSIYYADFAGFLCQDHTIDTVVSVVSSEPDELVVSNGPYTVLNGTVVEYELSGGKDGVEYDVSITVRVTQTPEQLTRVFPVRVSSGRWK